jgi:hypothetical protein
MTGRVIQATGCRVVSAEFRRTMGLWILAKNCHGIEQKEGKCASVLNLAMKWTDRIYRGR